MKKKIFKYYILNLILIINTLAYSKVIKVGVYEIPPLIKIEDNIKFSGLYIDTVSYIFSKTKYEYTFIKYPIKRLYGAIAKGNVDLGVGAYTNIEKYKGKILIDSVPFARHALCIFAIGDKKLPKAMSDITNINLLMLHGYSYNGYRNMIINPLKNNKIDNGAKSHLQALKKLKMKQGDYFLGYLIPTRIALKAMKILKIKYSILDVVTTYFVINEKRDNSRDILYKLSSILKDLPEDNPLKPKVAIKENIGKVFEISN